MSEVVTLDADDMEIVREHDEQYVRPKDIYESATAAPAMRHWKPRPFYARLRDMEKRGILERNKWVKHTCYREAVGAVAAIDRAYGSLAQLEVFGGPQ